MSNRQHIDTAPRDGTPILAWSNFYELPFVVYWGSVAEDFGPMPGLPEGSEIERRWMLGNSENGELLYEPTEWEPLK